MKQTQALTISIVIGFVVLGCISVVVLVAFPYEEVFGPTPTLTVTSTVTATPTFQIFLPTANSITPTSEPPSPTSTLLPTITPRPTQTPLPAGSFPVATIAVPPTSTPMLLVTLTLTPTATSAPRFYTFSFEADETEIDRGQCTQLVWQSSGPVSITVEGQPVDASDTMRVCPRDDTTYTLVYNVAGTSEVKTERITIKVNK